MAQLSLRNKIRLFFVKEKKDVSKQRDKGKSRSGKFKFKDRATRCDTSYVISDRHPVTNTLHLPL